MFVPARPGFKYRWEIQPLAICWKRRGGPGGGSWGGVILPAVNPNGTTGCARSTQSNITGVTETDYIPHHSFFAYWANTANPNHTRPASVSEIGTDGPANHQYDINDLD